MLFREYVRLIKFRYHVSFLQVIITVFLFSQGSLLETARSLALLYVSFNILLYGGIYALNDIADIESDRRHPLKRNRPLPSRRIALKPAFIFALLLITTGLASGYLFFGLKAFYAYLAFLFLTTFYTFVAKHMPYLELLVNSTTQALRPVLALIAIKVESLPLLLAAAYWFFALGFVAIRRIVERDVKGWDSNKVSRQYSKAGVLAITIASFLVMTLISFLDWQSHGLVYSIMALFYILFVFGIHFSQAVRNFCRVLLTR